MPMHIRVPQSLEVLEAVWNSEPFNVSFEETIYAKKFYRLDDSDCRTTLLNLLSVIDRFSLLEPEMQSVMADFISSASCLLAANIRWDDGAPLISATSLAEAKGDAEVARGWEKPISHRSQLTVEIQNAVRSVQHFDRVGPALAWAVLAYFHTSRDYASLEGVLRSEAERWKQSGEVLPLPRGCLRFLEKRLPLLGNFVFNKRDIHSILKYAALHDKYSAVFGTADLPFRRQIEKFTRLFVNSKLEIILAVDDITDSCTELVNVLLSELKKDPPPEIIEPLRHLHHFFYTIALPHNVSKSNLICCAFDSNMFSYLDCSRPQNQPLLTVLQCIQIRLQGKPYGHNTLFQSYVEDVVYGYREIVAGEEFQKNAELSHKKSSMEEQLTQNSKGCSLLQKKECTKVRKKRNRKKR